MAITLEKYETGLCIAFAIATIGSIGMSFITSSALTDDTSSVDEIETVASSMVTETTPLSTSTTGITTTTTEMTSTTVGTKIVSVINEHHIIETIIVPDTEMIIYPTETNATTTTNTTTTTSKTTSTSTVVTTTTTTTTTTDAVVVVNNHISDADYILLCNCVAHEAGSNSIPASEKAKVVEVVMNRVNSSSYPNTIYEVITQNGQFYGSSGYANLGTYSSQVNDLVKDGVDEYFSNIEQYQHGYTSFHGDGYQNYFK